MIIKLGIDLGTTNSCIAYHDGTSVKIMTLNDGRKTLPSCVMFDHGKVIVGVEAYEKRYLSKQVVYSAKRHMGTDTIYHIDDGDREFDVTPVDVSSYILKELKCQAEARFQSEFDSAVITVPAYFNDRQKKDTLHAAERAGFYKVRLLVEPSAAATAYTTNSSKAEYAVVYDLGGGTFDVSLLHILPSAKTSKNPMLAKLMTGKPNVATIEVLGIEGNNHLGGDDFDTLIYHDMCKQMNKIAREKYGFSDRFSFDKQISKERKEWYLLSIESIKKNYTHRSAGFGMSVNEKFGEVEFSEKYGGNMETLNRCFRPIFEKTIQCFNRVMERYSDKLDRIILIGGSTKFEPLSEALSGLYPGIDIYKDISPDYSVAIGAALVAAADDSISSVKLLDVIAQNIGIKTDKIEYSRVKKAIFEPVLPKNMPIPGYRHINVQTVEPQQTCVYLDVFEGDSLLAEENRFIGRLVIDDIIRKSQQTDIYVELSIDINGLLRIKARYDDTEKELELQNVIRSSNPVDQTVDNITKKKWNRYSRLLENYDLADEEKSIVEEQKRILSEESRFTDEFMALIEIYQKKELERRKMEDNAFVAAHSEVSENSDAAPTSVFNS